MKYKISFCVPVYNRALVTKKIVDNLLKSDNPNIQIVISDNHSTDNTLEILSHYSDPRLKIVSNEYSGVNIAICNFFNALENGDGEFLYLVMGRDKLHISQIKELIENLERASDDIGIFLDRCQQKINFNRVEMINFFCKPEHPTGLIFRKECWKKVINRKKFFTETTFPYPEIYIKAIILKSYKGILVSSGVFQNKFYINFSKQKSLVPRLNKNLYFCSTERRNQFFKINKVLEIFEDLSIEEKQSLMFNNYVNILNKVTFAEKKAFSDKELMGHYGLDTRNIGKLEMLHKCNDFFCEYFKDLIEKKYEWFSFGYILRIIIKTIQQEIKIIIS